ncbi:hypothetical protein PICMEDRAFT_72818 [Pichia membranifaciens NRRL Y-2026]|uniref:Uncharacterized protein n=1 Tax=Pichia membranifaciens NRRL Y-2026 TaxID=763406 RepID=A0A1E3NKY2_9ASCO|nr:hypothetical protein PICMEDRAFT_72818 [Pichia membranifaciens NRRL Y-2026]ODQ46781.1 hypothetical protein PICMEDRAFT_72818 [Pichia membranifaciens NRRL Y-2026]
MGSGNLSSRVKNMKFMQVAGDKHRKDQIVAAEKDGIKKLKDSSEWTLPVSTKALKVIKSKNRKVRKVGFSKINSMGPVNISKDLNDGTLGRMKLSSVQDANGGEKQDAEKTLTVDESDEKPNSDSERKEKRKSKRSKKSKKKSKVIEGFVSKSDEEFDPTEVDLTSKSLLGLWKANRK